MALSNPLPRGCKSPSSTHSPRGGGREGGHHRANSLDTRYHPLFESWRISLFAAVSCFVLRGLSVGGNVDTRTTPPQGGQTLKWPPAAPLNRAYWRSYLTTRRTRLQSPGSTT